MPLSEAEELELLELEAAAAQKAPEVGRDASSTAPVDTYDGPQFAAPDAAQANAQPVLSQGVDLSKETNVPIEEKVARRMRVGLSQNISAIPANLIAKSMGLNAAPSEVDRAQSLGTVGDLVTTGVGMIADPAGTALMGQVGKLVEKAPGVGRIFQTSYELAAAKQAAALEAKAVGEVADAAYRQAARKYFINAVSRDAVKGAAEFGAYSFGVEGADQINKGFDPAALAEHTAMGIVTGAAFGPLIGGVSRALGADPVMAASEQAGADRAAEKLQPWAERGVAKRLDQDIVALEAQQAELASQLKSPKTLTEHELGQKTTQLERAKADLEVLKAQREAMINPRLEPNDKALTELMAGDRPLSPAEATRLTTIADAQAQKAAELEASMRTTEAARKEMLGRSVDRQAQKAAELDSQIVSLRSAAADLRKQSEAIAKDPNKLTLSPADHGKISKLEQRAARLEAEAEKAQTRLEQVRPIDSAKLEKRAGRLSERTQRLNEQLNDVADQAAKTHQVLEAKRVPYSEEQKALLLEKLASARRAAAQANENSQLQFAQKLDKINRDIAFEEAHARSLDQMVRTRTQALPEKEAGKLSSAYSATSAKLEELRVAKAELLQRFQQFTKESGPLSVSQRLASGRMTKPEYVEQSLAFARKEAQQLVDRGVLPPEKVNEMGSFLFNSLVDAKGAGYHGRALPGQFVRGFVQKIELLNTIDKKLGTRIVDTVYSLIEKDVVISNRQVEEAIAGHQAIQSLKAKGMPPEEISNLLQYVEMDKATGIPFVNPAASKWRPEYAGPVAPQDLLLIHPELGAMRVEQEKMLMSLPESLRADSGYIEGHIPLMRKSGSLPTLEGSYSSLNKVPGSLEERVVGNFDPNIHEADPTVWWQRYVNSMVRYREMAPVMPQINREMLKLAWQGRADEANEFASVVATAMGVRPGQVGNKLISKEAIAAQMADYLKTANDSAIRKMVIEAGGTEDTVGEVAKLIKEAQYKAFVLHPAALIKQAIQPEVVGSAEIGMGYVNKGRAALLKKEWKDFAQSFDSVLINYEPGVLEELGAAGYKNGKVALASKVLGIPTKFSGIEKAYSVAEITNRRVSFLGGYFKFLDAAESAAGRDAALEGLLEGEKSRVIRILQEQGPEKAAQAYGVIRSYRTNFIFSSINKPELFKSGLGQMLPFTTWTSNQLARFATETMRIGEGGGKQLARRIAWPIVIGAAFKALSGGWEIPGLHPGADLARSFQYDVFPAAKEALKGVDQSIQQRSPAPLVRSVEKITPGFAHYERYQRNSKANDGKIVPSILGLRRAP